MRGIFLRAFLIVAVATAVGFGVNAVSPRRIPWLRPPPLTVPASEQIPMEEARRLWESGDAIFLDARPVSAFGDGHVAGALSLPLEDFEGRFTAVRPRLAPEQPLVLYCDGEHCDDSLRLLQRLRSMGYTNARVLVNGWTLWRRAGLPTSKGDAR
ncbi:MAG: rhodanese-like domain-containing protein [Verrucomicrobia bacterium]|nr:rhodanese-like domain-containing protein [Verrucomicrobiota bacterium]